MKTVQVCNEDHVQLKIWAALDGKTIWMEVKEAVASRRKEKASEPVLGKVINEFSSKRKEKQKK